MAVAAKDAACDGIADAPAAVNARLPPTTAPITTINLRTRMDSSC
jgi:hypothetical protein